MAFVLIATLISAVQGRVTGRAVLIAALATVALIVLYDLPFDDLGPGDHSDSLGTTQSIYIFTGLFAAVFNRTNAFNALAVNHDRTFVCCK